MPWEPYWVDRTLRSANVISQRRFAYSGEGDGKIALYPRTNDALQLAVPGGVPQQSLHLSLVRLGSDTSSGSQSLNQSLAQIADNYTVITTQVMGHGNFDPTGGGSAYPDQGGPWGRQNPDTIYLVTNSQQLSDIHRDVMDVATAQFRLPSQQVPWVPHVTAGHNMDPNLLGFTGQVLFDRIGLTFGGKTHYYPLLGSSVGEYDG